MSIWGKVGEFSVYAFTSYFATRARKKREQAMGSSDFCPESVKIHIGHGLNHCKPASKHYTVRGIQEIRKYLTKKQLLGAEIAIDTAAIDSRTSTACIILLKLAVACAVKGIDADDIRAATFTYLATR